MCILFHIHFLTPMCYTPYPLITACVLKAEVAELKKTNTALQEELDAKEARAHKKSKDLHLSFEGESLCTSIVLSRPALQVVNGGNLGDRSVDMSQLCDSSQQHAPNAVPVIQSSAPPAPITTASLSHAPSLPKPLTGILRNSNATETYAHAPCSKTEMISQASLSVGPIKPLMPLSQGSLGPSRVPALPTRPSVSEPKDPECTQS